MYLKIPTNILQPNKTEQKVEKIIAKGQKKYKDNKLLTELMSIYRSYEQWVSGWRGPEDWCASEYQV